MQKGEISLKDANGKSIASGVSEKEFNWVCISSPDIKESETYTLYINSENTASLECTSTVTANKENGGFMKRW